MQPPLAPVDGPCRLLDEAAVDKLFQDAGKALFRDFENCEQIRDPQTRTRFPAKVFMRHPALDPTPGVPASQSTGSRSQ